jgi:ubiquitin-protein ligase
MVAPRQIAEKPICGIFLPKNFPLNLPKILFAEAVFCRNIYLPKISANEENWQLDISARNI